jgi:hypothetical protein
MEDSDLGSAVDAGTIDAENDKRRLDGTDFHGEFYKVDPDVAAIFAVRSGHETRRPTRREKILAGIPINNPSRVLNQQQQEHDWENWYCSGGSEKEYGIH